MKLAEEALARLKAGNQRFVSSIQENTTTEKIARSHQQIEDQAPFAIILGCSDSRVPAEIVFDQGLGDLFVIRVAGNIVAPSQVGSIEFAAERYDTSLVVVMGHTNCGAILATLEILENPQARHSRALGTIVDRIKPAIETLVEAELPHDQLVRHSVRANIRASVNHLKHGSEILEHLIQRQGLMIVGAEYSLDTGEVNYL
ncbi:MAG: carbonic anhydrase [Parasphingorhabdus sp.]|jgi:carbonic anhydrase